MPEMSKHVIPPHMGDKNPSQKIIKLGKKISIAPLEEEVPVDPILLEFRTELLERANVQVIKRVIIRE